MTNLAPCAWRAPNAERAYSAATRTDPVAVRSMTSAACSSTAAASFDTSCSTSATTAARTMNPPYPAITGTRPIDGSSSPPMTAGTPNAR